MSNIRYVKTTSYRWCVMKNKGKLAALCEEAARLEKNLAFYRKKAETDDPLDIHHYLVEMEERRATYVENTIQKILDEERK